MLHISLQSNFSVNFKSFGLHLRKLGSKNYQKMAKMGLFQSSPPTKVFFRRVPSAQKCFTDLGFYTDYTTLLGPPLCEILGDLVKICSGSKIAMKGQKLTTVGATINTNHVLLQTVAKPIY